MTAPITPPNPFYVPLDREVTRSLDGTWRFAPDPDDRGQANGWHRSGVQGRPCPVPAAWQFLFDDLRDYRGPVWYQRELTVSSEHAGRRVALVFAGVDYHATVWMNGRLAGTHEDGYLPFAVDVSGLVSFDRPDRITVRASVPEDQLEIPGDETSGSHRSGIWRPVWMEVTGATHFCDLFVAPNLDAGRADLRIGITAPTHATERLVRLHLRADGPDGRAHAAEQELVLPAAGEPFSMEVATALAIDDPRPWTVEDPQLYRLHAVLTEGERTLDAASREFGMRTIDIDGIHLRLNGQPVYLMGAMDPQDIPDKNIYLPEYHAPTEDEIRNEVLLAKRMGLNCIRKHHQIDDHRYLRWADRLGLLVYGQPPCYRRITDASVRRWRRLVEGWVRRDRGHPSMLMWTLFNAAQGLEPMPAAYDKRAEHESAATTPEQRAEIVRAAHDLVKRLDPTRPVMDTAGGEFYRSEVRSLMRYGFSGPQYYRRAREHYPALRADRVSRIPGARSAQPDPDPKPLLVGELGGYIYFPDLDRFRRRWGGRTPWPILRSAGLGWGALGERMAAGYEERFRAWGLDQVYGGFAGLAERHDWSAFADIKDEVEQIRKGPDVTGYVFTMFSNMGPYVHGLLDYDLRLRPFHGELAKLNSPDLLIVDWEELNYWPGRTVRATLLVSHYGARPIAGCTVRWRLDGFDPHGEVTGVSMDAVGVRAIGSICFPAPAVERGTRARLIVELLDADEVRSANYVDLYLYPESGKRAPRRHRINVYRADRQTLQDAGYDAHDGIDPGIPVTVAGAFDARIDEYLGAGGTVLLFAGDGTEVGPELGVAIGTVGYALGTMPGCNFWAYVNPAHGLFGAIPYQNPLGWTFLKVLAAPPGQETLPGGSGSSPRLATMIGDLEPSVKGDILIGCYSEWLRSRSPGRLQGEAVPREVAALAARFRFKAGRIVLVTLDLPAAADTDPVAALMLHDLVGYCFSDFAPATALPGQARPRGAACSSTWAVSEGIPGS